jgi:hypothetical protein
MNPRRFQHVIEERNQYRTANRFLLFLVLVLLASLMVILAVFDPQALGFCVLIVLGLLMVAYFVGGVLWCSSRRDVE